MTARLVHASSPYLRQHADNPVDWYPWGDEAFAVARERNVPVFISIGYAACHWCHVMAHESFEDAEVGNALDASFVSIKVDREEHPAVDHFYMSACSAMGVRGGWPLTVLATPDRVPFYCATYLPKESRHGQIGLLTLLERVSRLWIDEPHGIVQFGNALIELLGRAEAEVEGGEEYATAREEEGGEEGADGRDGKPDRPSRPRGASFSENDLERGFGQLQAAFDPEWGGFSHAPKFPSPHQLLFLLRFGKRFRRPEAIEIVETTLDNMYKGGICDQIGGGFHRYATDREWRLPHFEKMLVDQAMLLLAYSETYQVTGRARYAAACEAIVTYVDRDMRSSGGVFYASEDADSEGSEGQFYLWSWEELIEILSEEERSHIRSFWHILPDGNVRDEASGEPTGLNLFFGGIPPDDRDAAAVWDRISKKLMTVRARRIRPMRDEKILTDWNGAMIASMAAAGRIHGRDAWIRMAVSAAAHLLKQVRDADGRLVHSWFEGQCAGSECLDDYANLTWLCLELFQATGGPGWLESAAAVAEKQIDLFWDAGHGGFFLAPSDEQGIPVRQKAYSDGATPSAASVSALNYLKLGLLLGHNEFERIGTRQLELSASMSRAFSLGFSASFSAIDFALGPVFEIVVVAGANGFRLLQEINRTYLPNSVLVQVNDANRAELSRLMPHLADYRALATQETVYLCVNRTCQMPITELSRLREAIGRS